MIRMSKNIAIKDVKNIVKNDGIPTYTITFGNEKDGTAVTAHMKRYLSIEEETLFVDKMCDAVFYNGVYQPEYHQIMFTIFIMQMLSDFPIPKKTKFFDINEFKKWDSVFHFMETIKASDNEYLKNYIDYLKDISWEKINFIKARIQGQSKFDDLFDSIKVLSDKFADKLDGIDLTKAVNQYTNKVVEELKQGEKNG